MNTRPVLLALTLWVGSASQPVLAQQPTLPPPGPAEPGASEVRIRGRLESARVITLRSELEMPAALLWIVEEGAPVKKGDLLVELDDAALRDKLATRGLELAKADAEREKVQEALALARQEMEQVVAIQEQNLKLAQLELEENRAEAALQLRLAQIELDLAKERSQMAEKHVEHRRKMAESGRVDQDAMIQAELALLEMRAALEKSRAQREHLEKHTGPRRTAAGELAVGRAKAELARAKSETQAKVRSLETALAVDETVGAMLHGQRKQLEDQLQRSKIHAPWDGMAVQAWPPGTAGLGDLLQPGSKVAPRQPLLRLIDTGALHVVGLVDQPEAGRLAAGQPAMVVFDARPKQFFPAKVATIEESPAQPGRDVAAPAWRVTVSLDRPAPGLKPGMTATVEIEAGQASER